MRLKYIIPLLGILCFSCSSQPTPEEVKAPEDLLSEKKLMDVIIDLQILESQYQFRYQRPEVYKNALDSASYFVYERHGTTRDQFARSYDYYALDIDLMYMIYEAALDSVNLMVTNQNQQ